MNKREIIHVCDSLSLQGGYEKVICDLSNIFLAKGHEISIVCLGIRSAPFYSLDKKVNIYYSYLAKDTQSFPKIFRLTRILLYKIWSIIYLKYILLKKGKHSILVFHRHGFNDHLDLSRFFSFRSYDLLHMDYSNAYCNSVSDLYSFFGLIRKPKSNIIVLTEKSRNDAQRDNVKNVIKINNPFVTEIVEHNEESKIFLNIGRYGDQKNQRIIIEAFRYIHELVPDWVLKIVGDGVGSSKELNHLIDVYDLRNKVFLFDKTNDPDSFLLEASVFILSSKFEGLPLVLLEAMACGNAIVSSKYAGHEEVLDSKNSLLFPVDDIQTLANLMYRIAIDKVLRLELTENARLNLGKFSQNEIYYSWLNNVLND